ncbi:hypothetical protein MYX07_01795 [Patescibacteria group bacterium AH-259-L07]|nr:hypothetical protein [Patescibacteria group bacterium AH-259-L07]
MKKILICGLMLGLTSSVHAQNQNGWSFQIKPLYTALFSGNNVYIGSEYYFANIDPSPTADSLVFAYGTIQKPIILYALPKWNLAFDLHYRKPTWGIGMRTSQFHNFAHKSDVITTPKNVRNEDGSSAQFTNGIELWGFDFRPLTNLKQESLQSPIWWRADNALDIRTAEVFLAHQVWNNVEAVFGIKYADIAHQKNVSQKQIIYVEEYEIVSYEDNLNMTQDSKTRYYVTGPSFGFKFKTKYFESSIQQAILFGEVNYKNLWISDHDIEVVVLEADTPYVYNAWQSIGELPFNYTMPMTVIPNTEINLDFAWQIYTTRHFTFNFGINLSASIFWQAPSIAQLTLPNGSSWFKGANWNLQTKTFSFASLGVNLGVNF